MISSVDIFIDLDLKNNQISSIGAVARDSMTKKEIDTICFQILPENESYSVCFRFYETVTNFTSTCTSNWCSSPSQVGDSELEGLKNDQGMNVDEGFQHFVNWVDDLVKTLAINHHMVTFWVDSTRDITLLNHHLHVIDHRPLHTFFAVPGKRFYKDVVLTNSYDLGMIGLGSTIMQH